MNKDSIQVKDLGKKRFQYRKCHLKKTVKIILILLLVFIILSIGTFFSCVAYWRMEKTILFTYETEKGHSITVTQLGRQEPITNTFLVLITVDDEAYVKFHLTASPGASINSTDISCTEINDEVSLKMWPGTLSPEIRFSSDFSVINFIRSESYTLLKKNIEVLEFELIDLF